MMKQRVVALALAVGVILAAVILIPSSPAFASGEITVSGEVVDMACYIAHDAKGPDHKKCALKCAQMGQPIGLLAADGKVYLLVADHTDQAPYEKARKLAGEKVTIKGESDTKDGISALSVKEVK